MDKLFRLTMQRKLHVPTISAENEEKLWKEAIIVYDTSALCNLYGLTSDAKNTFVEILHHLKDRIWIPARVMTEYERHRNEMQGQIISEHYKTPDFLSTHYLSKLNSFIEGIKNNPLNHPQFDDDSIAELTSSQESAKTILDKIRIVTENAIKAGKDRVKNDFKHDILFDEIIELKTGTPFSYKEILEIVKEGDIRYRHCIPPGYMDFKDKSSIDRFGDLIIWKEILKYAAAENKSIIFICDDVKEDWNANGNTNKGLVPREELLEEFHSTTGHNIWFYTLNSFIDNLIKRIDHEEVKENNDKLTAVLRELEIINLPDDYIKVICEHCGAVIGYSSDDFDWDWDYESSDERSMGSEICFKYEDYHVCPECEHEFNFAFDLYEYPINIVNFVSLETEGCKAISIPPLEDFIRHNNYEACVRCGEYSDTLNEEGFCQNCMDEFDYECSRDD